MRYKRLKYSFRSGFGVHYCGIAFCLLSFVFIPQSAALAQTSASPKSTGSLDSSEIRQLFFSALREKTVENLKHASELFERVIQADPRNDASLYELANLKKIQNDYANAQPLLERAVAVKPDNEWYWSALADSYEKSNNIGKLENVFNQLIRINPNKPEYYFDKANALVILKRYDDALAVYDQLEEIAGPSDDILGSRQKVYLKQGKIDKAAADIEKAIAENPGQIRYYLLLSEIYNSNGLTDKAVKVLLQAENWMQATGRYIWRLLIFTGIKKVTTRVLRSLPRLSLFRISASIKK